VLKSITEALISSKKKLDKGNWILKDGKNKYRKVILPTRPFQLWTGDWKEIKILGPLVTVYAFFIIDTYTKIIVGWSLSIVKTERSAIEASELAIKNYSKHKLFKARDLIMHTDQGSAYVGETYTNYWRSLGVKLSYAARGKPTQNPWSEAIISIASRFCLKYYEFESLLELDKILGKFITNYNKNWIHNGLGHISPLKRLAEYSPTKK
jgi:putative transposase